MVTPGSMKRIAVTGPVCFEFFHPCQPPTATAQERQHTRAGRTYLPASALRARAWYQAVLEQYAPPVPLVGPVEVCVSWTFGGPVPGVWFLAREINDPRLMITRPDLDNSVKLLLDVATQIGYWHNDSQVARLNLTKFKTSEEIR